MEFKRCSKCKTDKLLTEFYSIKGKPYSQCKTCHRAYTSQSKSAMKKRMGKYFKERRKFIDKAKDQPCADCGNKYPPCVMDFDHKLGTKKFSIGSTMASHTIRELVEEMEKCEIVCANCHRIRTWILRKRRIDH